MLTQRIEPVATPPTVDLAALKIKRYKVSDGDRGHTKLRNSGDCELGKNCAIFNILGTIDEVNCHIAVILASAPTTAWVKYLPTIQTHLMQMTECLQDFLETLRWSNAEEKVDWLNTMTRELKDYLGRDHRPDLYPGGHINSARIELARTVVRRLERLCVPPLAHPDSEEMLAYINRLSTYLALLATRANRCYSVEERRYTSQYVPMHSTTPKQETNS